MPRRSAASFSVISIGATQPRLRPPDGLAEPERTLFLDIVTTTRPEHFQAPDGVLLAAYCRAVILEQQAAGELAAQGHVLEGGTANPWLDIHAQAVRQMVTLSRTLRLSPVSRQPTVTSRARLPSPPASYYDRMSL
jgi:phage terminase small subunit